MEVGFGASGGEYKPVINFTRDDPHKIRNQINDKSVEKLDTYNETVEKSAPPPVTPTENIRAERINPDVKLATVNAVASAPVVEAQNNPMTSKPTSPSVTAAYNEAQAYNKEEVGKAKVDVFDDISAQGIKEFEAVSDEILVREKTSVAETRGFEARSVANEYDVANSIADVPVQDDVVSKEKVEAISKVVSKPEKPFVKEDVVVEKEPEVAKSADIERKIKSDELTGAGKASAENVSQNFSVESPMAAFVQAAHAYSQVQQESKQQPAINNAQLQSRIREPERMNLTA